jgi:hypothetical protein
MPHGKYTFFMFDAERRINGGDLIRHGARRREAATTIYKYIGIGRGVTQAPLPLPLIFKRKSADDKSWKMEVMTWQLNFLCR